jgi:hypothetical protein
LKADGLRFFLNKLSRINKTKVQKMIQDHRTVPLIGNGLFTVCNLTR